jgi:hypothetical protein
MRTVLSSPEVYNLDVIPTGFFARANGHPDESTVILGSETPPADFAQVLDEIDTDRSIQAADDAHRSELASAFARAKALIGLATIQIGRQITRDDQGGKPEDRAEWFCIIANGGVGFGPSANAAVDEALAALDKRAGIACVFGGYRIPGVAIIFSYTHRTRDEALAIARRIALEPAYLDGAVEFLMPGILDERPKRIAIAA